jgi:hypothetical protein
MLMAKPAPSWSLIPGSRQLTTDQVDHFVIAAYKNLCPVPGAYDWWAYSTS